jgi:hypothetical protein
MMRFLYPQDYQKVVKEYADVIKKENKFIHSYGVELEGGVSYRTVIEIEQWLREIDLHYRFDSGYDGSVDVSSPYGYVNDWISDAELRFWIETERIEILLELVWRLWEKGFRQNSTCGNHIHVKFYDNEYVLTLIFNEKFVELFQRKYQAYAYKRASKYGEKYIRRMYNNYCKFLDRTAFPEVLYVYQNSRYYAVNFCSVDENNTLEFRILPYCDSPREFAENLVWLNRVLNGLIQKFVDMEKILSIRISIPKPERIKPETVVEEVSI